jgi:DNA recombination protein RmuC
VQSIIPLLYILVGLAIGFGAAWMLLQGRVTATRTTARSEIETERSVLESQLSAANTTLKDLTAQIAIREKLLEERQRVLIVESNLRSGAEAAAKQIPALRDEMSSIAARLDRSQSEARELQSKLVEANTALKKERESSLEKMQLLQDAQKQLSSAFEAMSAKALETNNTSFLHLAKATLETFQQSAKGDLEKRQQAISDIVKPVRESLDKVDDKIKELENSRVGAYSMLMQQVQSLQESQTLLRGETTQLVRALRAPSSRGRWGEIQLKRVVEMAGMIEHCDFDQQTSKDTEAGRQRPDMIINLPGGKTIIVDAKVPLAAYMDAMDSQDEDVRKQMLIDHARQVRTHVTQLGKKSYWESFGASPEFVVLFLVDESSLYRALEADSELLEYGVESKVLLATPITLIALLRSANYGWEQEKFTENANQIRDLASKLYQRLATFGEHLASVGKSLRSSVESYNKSVRSLEGSVLPAARKFPLMGVSPGTKEIAEIRQVETEYAAISAPELLSPITDDVNTSAFDDPKLL